MPAGLPLTPTLAFAGGLDGLRVRVAAERERRDAGLEAETEAAWHEMRAENPRLFDGAIVAFESFDVVAGVLSCRIERYRRAAVQPGVENLAMLLGVTALLTSVDAEGREVVFLGRRGAGTRVYGGMWELGPSGGVDAPERAGEFGVDWLRGAVLAEVREELGYAGDVEIGSPVAIDSDAVGRAVELVLPARVGSPIGFRENWEYSEGLWLTRDGLRRFVGEQADQIIGPTLRVLGVLGMV